MPFLLSSQKGSLFLLGRGHQLQIGSPRRGPISWWFSQRSHLLLVVLSQGKPFPILYEDV